MFDSFFNLIIVLIPLAIFIGRIVVRARGKHHPPPKPTLIPVHFEDDGEEEEYLPYALENQEYFREPLRKQHEEKALVPPVIYNRVFSETETRAPPVSVKDFSHRLNRLSPMKKAVVMAEILGSPKGMTRYKSLSGN